MNILAINTSNFGSTGNIMINISQQSSDKFLFAVASSRSNRKKRIENCIEVGNRFSRNLNLLLYFLTGDIRFGSRISTFIFLKKTNKFKPDLIHLHNLHNGYINVPMLFRYIKKHNIPVIWTLHDCWSFTGKCPHFSLANCSKWKTGCFNCPYFKAYPKTLFDNSKKMWKLKKKVFTSLNNVTIVTPSIWLSKMVSESYLKKYNRVVINNGVNLSIFKKVQSNFKKNMNIHQPYIVLGVAMPWSYKKGLDVFIELEKILDKKKYKIVLVGTDSEVDNVLPKDIISIHRTYNSKDLVEIYSSASVFVNPTREETFGIVNIESLACGTPVVTFKSGGSPETIDDSSGICVNIDDLHSMEKSIIKICESKIIRSEDCIKRSHAFESNAKINEYLHLYDELKMCNKEG